MKTRYSYIFFKFCAKTSTLSSIFAKLMFSEIDLDTVIGVENFAPVFKTVLLFRSLIGLAFRKKAES